MYHVVAAAPPGAPYSDLWVAPGRFTQQMRALAHAGYHATTLDAVWRAWHGHGSLPRHPRRRSPSTTATRASRPPRGACSHRLGWPGVLNLEVKNVGLKGGLARNEVRAMLRDGWEIDAHTLTHPDLTTVDAARLRREVAGSRRWLRHAFGVARDFFAYPVGPLQPGRRGGGPRRGLHGRDHHPAGPGHARRGPLRPAAAPRHAAR